MKDIFAKRLREERNRLGLLQKEMAAKLNMPPNTYNGYETGKRLPDMETVSKIADILGVSVDYLLGRTDVRNPYEKDEGITTIAAHRTNGYDEPLTEEELFAIEQFKEFLKQQKKKKKEDK